VKSKTLQISSSGN